MIFDVDLILSEDGSIREGKGGSGSDLSRYIYHYQVRLCCHFLQFVLDTRNSSEKDDMTI